MEFAHLLFSRTIIITFFSSFILQLASNSQESEDKSPCDKLGARFGYLFRNLVAHAYKEGDWATVRQQPCTIFFL